MHDALFVHGIEIDGHVGIGPIEAGDGALEGDLAAICLNGDALCIQPRVPRERPSYRALDLVGRRSGLDADEVGDALDASQPTHGLLRRVTLVLPLDLAFEVDPSVPNDGLDVLR